MADGERVMGTTVMLDGTDGTARIIDGKAHAARVRGRVADAVAGLRARGIVPGLAVVLVGDDPASQVYVRSKERKTAEVGMASFAHRLPAGTTQIELLALVARLNADRDVHGILVQFPLPAHMDEGVVAASIDPAKDVDGFHAVSQGRLALGLPGLVPCTPLGCLLLLRETLGDLSGADAVVIGRSFNVGQSAALLLTRENATVTLTHSRTRDLPGVVRRADIVVAAAGRAEMVRGDWLKPGSTVIDVGINRTDAGLVGDCHFESCAAVAGAITPVPGGVGPMTIACLLANAVTAASAIHGLPAPEGLTA